MENNKLLSEHKVDKIKFYTDEDPICGKTFTVCLLINSEERTIQARGVAICSLKEPFCLKNGKNRAFGRAMAALHRRKNQFRINKDGREKEVITRLFKIKNEEEKTSFGKNQGKYLSMFYPKLKVAILDGDNKFLLKYLIKIPANYPIAKANKFFKYKAQFRPEASNKTEVEILRSLPV